MLIEAVDQDVKTLVFIFWPHFPCTWIRIRIKKNMGVLKDSQIKNKIQLTQNMLHLLTGHVRTHQHTISLLMKASSSDYDAVHRKNAQIGNIRCIW
jgi:hypothetical protein